jgi:hypothetical protein
MIVSSRFVMSLKLAVRLAKRKPSSRSSTSEARGPRRPPRTPAMGSNRRAYNFVSQLRRRPLFHTLGLRWPQCSLLFSILFPIDHLTTACVSQCTLGQLERLEVTFDGTRSTTACLLHVNPGFFSEDRVRLVDVRWPHGEYRRGYRTGCILLRYRPARHPSHSCNWLFLVASPLLDYSHNILRAWPFRPVHIKNALMIV